MDLWSTYFLSLFSSKPISPTSKVDWLSSGHTAAPLLKEKLGKYIWGLHTGEAGFTLWGIPQTQKLGVQKVVSSHKKTEAWNETKYKAQNLYIKLLVVTVWFPNHGTGGNAGHPRGAGEESSECFLLTSFLVLQTVPDGRKSLRRPLAGPFSKSWPSTTAQGQAARAVGKDDSPTRAQPALHNNLEI